MVMHPAKNCVNEYHVHVTLKNPHSCNGVNGHAQFLKTMITCTAQHHCNDLMPEEVIEASKKIKGRMSKHHQHKLSAWPCLQILVVKIKFESCLNLCLTLWAQNCEEVPGKNF